MNARTHLFEVAVEPRQVEESILSVFHPILFYRSHGKFTFQDEATYKMGTLGYEDVDCSTIDLTYVRCNSPDLDTFLKREVTAYATALHTGVKLGQISLEFYQRRRKWPFAVENIPWEVWTVKTEVTKGAREKERGQRQEKVAEVLTEKIFYITGVMNRPEYVPKLPQQGDMDLIFDTSYQDVQPYLFNISYTTPGPSSSSMGNAMRKLLKDTLAI